MKISRFFGALILLTVVGCASPTSSSIDGSLLNDTSTFTPTEITITSPILSTPTSEPSSTPSEILTIEISSTPNYSFTIPFDHCSQEPKFSVSHLNVWHRSFVGSTYVEKGGAYWIRMSIGFKSEAEARADQPDVKLTVTLNGANLTMHNGTLLELNPDEQFWEVNSYHCTGELSTGDYTITGQSCVRGQCGNPGTFTLYVR